MAEMSLVVQQFFSYIMPLLIICLDIYVFSKMKVKTWLKFLFGVISYIVLGIIINLILIAMIANVYHPDALGLGLYLYGNFFMWASIGAAILIVMLLMILVRWLIRKNRV